MKQVTCPRCRGTGFVEEGGTLVGLSPFQDRPSTVDDDGWIPPPEESGDLTRVQKVPSFTPPKRVGPRIPSPRPPPDNTRIARDSERPTSLLARPHEGVGLLPYWVILTVAAAGALGFATGTGLLAAWFTFARHVIRSKLGW